MKKNFQRCSKLLEEQYINLHSVHVKEDNDVYVVKDRCAASWRQVDRWVNFALKKDHARYILSIVGVLQGQLIFVLMHLY